MTSPTTGKARYTEAGRNPLSGGARRVELLEGKDEATQ